jgi:hypothetical protein
MDQCRVQFTRAGSQLWHSGTLRGESSPDAGRVPPASHPAPRGPELLQGSSSVYYEGSRGSRHHCTPPLLQSYPPLAARQAGDQLVCRSLQLCSWVDRLAPREGDRWGGKVGYPLLSSCAWEPRTPPKRIARAGTPPQWEGGIQRSPQGWGHRQPRAEEPTRGGSAARAGVGTAWAAAADAAFLASRPALGERAQSSGRGAQDRLASPRPRPAPSAAPPLLRPSRVQTERPTHPWPSQAPPLAPPLPEMGPPNTPQGALYTPQEFYLCHQSASSPNWWLFSNSLPRLEETFFGYPPLARWLLRGYFAGWAV